MNIRTSMGIVVSLALAFLASSGAAAGDFIFANGFESGALCAWSSSPCSVDSLLSQLESATTVEENGAALLGALETTIGSVPPEVHDAVDAVAELFTEFPMAKGDFLSIAQAHELATMSLDSPPTLQQALAALTADVEQAYANPLAPQNAEIILMFSATSEMPSPLPLTADTELTFTGSIYYPTWLVENFPLSFTRTPKDTPAQCRAKVATNQIAAIGQIVVRNVFVINARYSSAIFNAGQALATCGSGLTLELVGIIVDAVESCVVSQIVSWVEVEADAECIGDVPSLPSAAGCIAGLVPCLGDIYSAIDSTVGVAQAVENLVNGVCTAINSREGLYAACDAGCPECSELNVDFGCFLGMFTACFDPVNSLPTVSCVESDDPGCADYGVPVITRIDGLTVILGGSSVTNRLYFTDEDAGINWFSSTAVADTCGGCASSGGWDPGVGQETSGSFPFTWYCTCGYPPVDFQATYHHRLHDSQGNVSLPYTQQVGCSCASSGKSATSESEEIGRESGLSGQAITIVPVQ